jgi:hypothetical protein
MRNHVVSTDDMRSLRLISHLPKVSPT